MPDPPPRIDAKAADGASRLNPDILRALGLLGQGTSASWQRSYSPGADFALSLDFGKAAGSKDDGPFYALSFQAGQPQWLLIATAPATHVECIEAALELAPVQTLALGRDTPLPEVLALPATRNIRSFELNSSYPRHDAAGLARFLSALGGRPVRELSLVFLGSGALAGALGQLQAAPERLVLRGARSLFTAKDLIALLTRCRELRIPALTLDDVAFEPGALSAFFAGLARTPLDSLVLRGHDNRLLELPVDAVVSWLASAAQLRELALEHTTLGDEVGLHFGNALSFGALERLSLQHSRIGPSSLRALAERGTRSRLRDLDLRRSNVGPRVHELFESTSALLSLQRIGLSDVGYVKATDVDWNDGASSGSGSGTDWTPLTAAEISRVTGLTLEIY